MFYRLLADLVVFLHFGFVLFAVFGGLFVIKWTRIAWIHLPSAIWAVLIECMGWICPLTPLEIWLRELGGELGYRTGFIEHYILPLLYPAHLTRRLQIILGLGVLSINALIYGYLLYRRKKNPFY